MIICDTHCDTLYRIVEEPNSTMDITLEILHEAKVGLQVMAMFVGDNNDVKKIKARNIKMLNEFDKLKNKGLNQVMCVNDIEINKANAMLSIEGCECISDYDDLLFYFNKGVRMAGVTWNYENDLGYPAICGIDKGLKPYGKELIRQMQQLGIAIDLSHLNEAGFYDVIEEFDAAPLASHSCAKALCDHFRNLTDDQLKVLFKKGGYVGINFCPAFLTKNKICNIDNVIDHIIYMMDIGGVNSVGLGSDFDGISEKPIGLDNPLGLKDLVDRMIQRKLSSHEIDSIMGNNFINYLKYIESNKHS